MSWQFARILCLKTIDEFCGIKNTAAALSFRTPDCRLSGGEESDDGTFLLYRFKLEKTVFFVFKKTCGRDRKRSHSRLIFPL